MTQPRGVVLIEVLAALLIFSAAGVAALTLLGQIADAQYRAHATERRLIDEERLLAAHTLLTRHDLDRRLGVRRVGPYLVRVDRTALSLYSITVGDSASADLVTLVYRPAELADVRSR